MPDAGAASRRSEVRRSDGNGSARLSLRPAPPAPGCRFPQATKISSERGRAPVYDGMIKASLERRHHVQRCKIKALRAKTNTYIKTPVRGEEPVFMVTGRREDVAMARREIISAAEHFSMIRASRNKAGTTFGSAPTLPGQVTIRVRVPYRVVGLVVGPKGATIKRIQQQTNTYIITPSRDRDPVFEITGAPGNVERAREEIETHIAVRTGKILEYNNENDFLSSSPDSGMENRYSEAWRVHTPAPGCKPLSTFRQNSLGCIGDCSVDPVYETPRLNDQNDFNYGYLFPNYGVNKQDLYYGVPESGAPMWAGQENTNPVSVLFSKQQRSSSTGAIHPNSHRSPSSSIQEPNLSGLPRRSQGEPLQGFSKLGTTTAARTSVSSSRECMVCFESEVTAALVPFLAVYTKLDFDALKERIKLLIFSA
ncbi:RNA-binding protein MEX3A [Egretta garzetta]|uniref:RNA-binding protein MEX3A n=1 Tax=Egretta garzetta TaxID=188379 RepID=UPI00051EFF1B|nr:RNA-binding protein MEX3A [Egretta garzetta]